MGWLRHTLRFFEVALPELDAQYELVDLIKALRDNKTQLQPHATAERIAAILWHITVALRKYFKKRMTKKELEKQCPRAIFENNIGHVAVTSLVFSRFADIQLDNEKDCQKEFALSGLLYN